MTGFSVTFERYLPHADEEDVCDADERGFVIENVSLRDALRLGLEFRDPSWAGYCEPDSYPAHNVRWLTFFNWNAGTREEIEQGVKEARSLHFPDTLTESSRRRVARLFNAYGA